MAVKVPPENPMPQDPPARTDPGAGRGAPAQDSRPEGIVLTRWHFRSLAVVLVTLLVIVIAGFIAKGPTDSVTGIIGASVPPFATIAAAIFGIKAVWDSGRASGEAAGREVGERDKAEAVREARREVARAVSAPLRRVDPQAARHLVGELRRGGESPAGSAGVRMYAGRTYSEPEVFEFGDDLLEGAEQPSREVEVALMLADQYLER